MQELLENLESNIKGCEIALIDNIDKEFVKGIKRALEDIKIDLENSLEKEKEQIIDAYNRGICDNEVLDGQDHYNQTYNQN